MLKHQATTYTVLLLIIGHWYSMDPDVQHLRISILELTDIGLGLTYLTLISANKYKRTSLSLKTVTVWALFNKYSALTSET